MQHWHRGCVDAGLKIAYFSKTLGLKASAQSLYEKSPILAALKKWRHYLLGSKVIIRTDQQTLKFITSQRLTEGVQHFFFWFSVQHKLVEFHYMVEYNKGKENKVADGRCPFQKKSGSYIVEQLSAITTSTPDWTQDIINSYATDAKCQKWITKLQCSPQPHCKYTYTGGTFYGIITELWWVTTRHWGLKFSALPSICFGRSLRARELRTTKSNQFSILPPY